MTRRMRIAVLVLAGCCVCGMLSSVRAEEDTSTGDDAAQANKAVTGALQRLERSREAFKAHIVSSAWMQAADLESKLTAAESGMLILEKRHQGGAVSDEQYESDSCQAQVRLARARADLVRHRVERFAELVDAGMSTGSDLEQARAELKMSELALVLAKLGEQHAGKRMSAEDYYRASAKLMEEQAQLARRAAAQKVTHAEKLFAAGMATSLDVGWAKTELVQAEDEVRRAAIEVQSARGEISHSQADLQTAELWADATARRVRRLEAILADSETGHRLGLVEQELVDASREDLELARKELEESRAQLQQVREDSSAKKDAQ